MKTNIINNLADFLNHFGAKTPADAGRQIYKHSCGLNTQFIQLTKDVPAEVETVNYSDTKAQSTLEGCTGINFTSIVEGSEVEVDGYSLDFPFTEQQLEDTIKGINDEVSFYLERDNDGWKAVLDSMNSEESEESEESWGISGSINGPDEDGDMTPVPNTKATIEKLDKSDFVF